MNKGICLEEYLSRCNWYIYDTANSTCLLYFLFVNKFLTAFPCFFFLTILSLKSGRNIFFRLSSYLKKKNCQIICVDVGVDLPRTRVRYRIYGSIILNALVLSFSTGVNPDSLKKKLGSSCPLARIRSIYTQIRVLKIHITYF